MPTMTGDSPTGRITSTNSVSTTALQTYVNTTASLNAAALGSLQNATLAFNGMAAVSGASVLGKTYNTTMVIGTGKKGRIEALVDVGVQVAAISSTNNLVPKYRIWEVVMEYYSTKPFFVLPFVFQATQGSTWTSGRDALTNSIPFEIGQWLDVTEFGHNLGPVQASRSFFDNGTLRFHVKVQLRVTALANLYAKGLAKLELESRPTNVPDFIIGHGIFADEAQTVTVVGHETILLRQLDRKPNWAA